MVKIRPEEIKSLLDKIMKTQPQLWLKEPRDLKEHFQIFISNT